MQTPPPLPTQVHHENEPRHGKKKVAPAILGGAAVLAVGLLGGLFIPTPGAAEAETETVTETETVEVETTPQACLDALDLGDEVMAITSDVLEISLEGWEATGNNDYITLERIADDVDLKTQALDDISDDFIQAKNDCRGF